MSKQTKPTRTNPRTPPTAKHTTMPARDFAARRTEVVDEYDNLPEVNPHYEIEGWFTPSADRPLPQVVKGEILDLNERRKPGRNQAQYYFLIRLAEPVVGLVMQGKDSDATEGELPAGAVVGLDMRQALEPIAHHRGKVRIEFVERVTLDDGRTWWRVKVGAQVPTAPAPSAARSDDIPF